MSSTDVLEAGSKTFFTGVKMLGAITVAFFIMLGSVLYNSFIVTNKLQITVADQSTQLTRIEGKIDIATDVARTDRSLNAYFLRQICINGAITDLQKTSCNPPPSILQRE